MVGFCHRQIPTLFITDKFPPGWVFVVVGMCWVTIIINKNNISSVIVFGIAIAIVIITIITIIIKIYDRKDFPCNENPCPLPEQFMWSEWSECTARSKSPSKKSSNKSLDKYHKRLIITKNVRQGQNNHQQRKIHAGLEIMITKTSLTEQNY